MPAQPGPTVRRRQVSSALRRYRTDAGLSVQQVAERLLCSPAKISRIETAQRNPTLRDVRDLLDMYGVVDEQVRERLMSMARESRERGWWQTLNLSPGLEILIGMERVATQIKEFEIINIPGLLQTREYATESLREWFPNEPEQCQLAVDIRMRRQRILKEAPKPQMIVILDEAALRRMVGGPAVMRGQLEHLIDLMDTGALELRIIPFSAGAHLGMLNGFTMLEFDALATDGAEPDIPPVAYVEYQYKTMYFDQETEIEEYARTFTALRARSITPRDSRALLKSFSDAL
ncbi:helix-turn-helix transcriptional regulator [Actinoplanes sp. NPDC051633]|uniref:helix-turn-helix domain-containing protein n=1 Tax=Actinoplanes sp. NPDC051633 TaxID=3155670 RepID=UPI00341C9FCE